MYYVSIGGANGMVGLALDMSPAAGREAGKARLEVPKLVSSNRLASTPVKWYGRSLDHARLLALPAVPYHSFTFLCTSFGPLQSLRLDNACEAATTPIVIDSRAITSALYPRYLDGRHAPPVLVCRA